MIEYKNKNIKINNIVILFDMDGLMFNTETLFSDTFSRITKKRGKEFTLTMKNRMMGQKIIDAINILIKELGINESPEVILRELKREYLKLLKTEIQPMPGLFKLLDLLEKRNIRKVVATSSLKEWVDIIFNNFKLYPRFEFVITGEEIKKGKPNPEIYLKAVEKLNTNPRNCLVLEDVLNGIKAAKEAGCMAVAVPNQYTKHQDFSEADLVVNSLDSLFLLNFIYSKS